MASGVSRKVRYHTDPEYRERRLKQAAIYKAKNPNKYREWQRADREKNPQRWANYTRKANGLPEPTRPEPKFCEICGAPPAKRSLCLDHERFTHTFRGWLCSNCNVGLGHFRDNPVFLELAAAYLRKFHE